MNLIIYKFLLLLSDNNHWSNLPFFLANPASVYLCTWGRLNPWTWIWCSLRIPHPLEHSWVWSWPSSCTGPHSDVAQTRTGDSKTSSKGRQPCQWHSWRWSAFSDRLGLGRVGHSQASPGFSWWLWSRIGLCSVQSYASVFLAGIVFFLKRCA